MNYLKEGATQEKFRQVWIHQSKLVIPQVRMDLSTEEILVQSFEASRSLKELKDESCEVKASCSRLLSEFFVNGLLESGWIHTDLHPKNWGFRPEADQLVIYDFGATLKLNDQLRSALRSLAEGTAVSPIDCLNCYAQLGFDPMVLQEISHKLPEVSEIIFRPFRNASSGAVAFNFNQWRVGEDVEAVLGEKKWLFRTGGPPWFLMVIRGFGGWLLALQTLSDPFTASELFRPQEEQECQFRLRVQVIEGESEMVSIELPATSVYSLEGLLPDHVEIELLREGVSMSEIKKRAIHSGLVPQLLFETKKGNKSYKVWIE